MTPEQLSTQKVRVAASSEGARVFRNNSGVAQVDGRIIRFGLGNDSAKMNKILKFGDYIGYKPVVITPEMVGQTVAVFVNLEVKPEGKMQATLAAACNQGTRENVQWETCNKVVAAGGYAGFVTNEEDVKKVLNHE